MEGGGVIEIILRPLGRGRFEARHGERIILVSSRQPLLDAARVFLAAGVPPDTRIAMRHAGADHDALSSTIGAAAKLTVRETPTDGPRLTRHEPYESGISRKGPSPVRFGEDQPSD
jgi:hypothetical protein